MAATLEKNNRTTEGSNPFELSIVIVNWNCGALLHRCIETIVNSEPQLTYETLVVDNNSTDDSLELLINSDFGVRLLREEKLRIIRNSENCGFGPANNQAFSASKSPFIFLLNPDTEVSPGTIDRLAADLKSSPRIGACSPKILNADGSVQISVWHNPPRVWQTLLSQLKLYMLLPPRLRGELLLGGHWAHDRKRTVPMLSGAAIMVRREMVSEVGGFDERFRMYAEDNEWCFRISRAGWLLLFEPSATVLHHGSQSAVKRWTNMEKIRIKLDAWYLFERKSLPRWRLIANGLANLIIASIQKFWRDLRGIKAPEIALIQQLHWENLKRSLKRDQRPRPKRKEKADADNLA